MKDISSTEAKTHFGALLDMAQREPVTIRKKGRAVAVVLSMQDFKEHEAMKLQLLQQAIDEGLDSGLSDRSIDDLIAEAEREVAAAGLAAVAEALNEIDATGAGLYAAELYRLRGELLVYADCRWRTAEWTPEDGHQKALDIARRQQAKALELRAAMSLAHLWQCQGKRQDAYDLLAPVYGWFSEGFDTVALKKARGLLTELT